MALSSVSMGLFPIEWNAELGSGGLASELEASGAADPLDDMFCGVMSAGEPLQEAKQFRVSFLLPAGCST
jgi:hypothetical protein